MRTIGVSVTLSMAVAQELGIDGMWWVKYTY